MSNPTSNFGWQMPTPTDLVTDLPADFEVFGQAVDSTMADLKGGTSGQILSKNSNTDMDFTWITNDQGDITGVTAGTGLTGGGTSGAVTLTLDQANYGNGINAAGRNKVINGGFDIWQRGTSFSYGGAYTFSADRFQGYGYSGAQTVTQQTFTPGTAPVAGYEGQYFMRVSCNNTTNYFLTRVEDVRTLAGQTATLSFWMKSASAQTLAAVAVVQNFGSGGSGSVTALNNSSTAIITSWVRYSFTFSMPSISGKTVGTGSYLQLDFQGAINNAIDIWGVQLEVGSTATPFSRNASSIQGELAACQRYYYQTDQSLIWLGQTSSGSSYYVTTYLPVSMRIAPTVNPTSTGGSGFSSTISTSNIGKSSFWVYCAATSTSVNNFQYSFTASAEL